MRIVTVDRKDRAPTVKYSDVNLRVSYAGKGTIVYDMDSIKQNILAILGTPIHTKWFRPEIGHRLDYFLFDPIDDKTASKITDEIYRILSGPNSLEDRIRLTNVEVIPDTPNQNYYCNIVYVVPTLNDGLIEDNLELGLSQ